MLYRITYSDELEISFQGLVRARRNRIGWTVMSKCEIYVIILGKGKQGAINYGT